MKKLFFTAIRIVIIIGIIIHFIIKDYVLITAIIFYALPLPILILMTLFLAVITKKLSRKSSLIVALILVFIWIKQSYVYNNYDYEGEGFEIVFWNASHDRNFEDAFEVSSNIPDVLVLVESHSEEIDAMKLKYPNYYFFWSESEEEITIFSKTPLEVGKLMKGKDNSKLINFKTNGFNFYVVDISAGIFKRRKISLDFVDSNIIKNEKTIVLGDFNTPYESVHFSNMKKSFVHAFSEKGNGFRETWFWNIPLLSLDHIWVSEDLEIHYVEKINTFKSDHSMLKMVLNN